MQTLVSKPVSKKYILWSALQAEEPQEDKSIKWTESVRNRLMERLGGNANPLTVQSLLNEMERGGYIERARRRDGRYVLSITLVKEPPMVAGTRPSSIAKPTTSGNGTKSPVAASDEIYAEVIEITPDLAMEWLDRNVHNRTLRQQFIDRLAAAIKRGEWVVNAESIKINPTDLVDGQHRLWAIVQADMPVKALVAFNVPMTAQETIDTGVKRTLGDMLRLRGEKEATTLAAALVQLHIWLTKGMLGLEGAFYPTAQQALALLENHPEIRDSVNAGRRLNKIGFPAGLGASVHWIINRIDSADAEDFYDRLANGHNLDDGNPILVLRDALLDWGPIHNNDRKKLAAFAIKAWNFYRGGNEIKRLIWKAGGVKPEPFPKPV